MSKFTLFLIHGIGVHKDASWADETIQMMANAWQRDMTLNQAISDFIDIVPISYDEVFEDYLDDFSDLSTAVFNDALPLEQSERESLATTFEQQNVTQRHFLWSHVADVLLYKMPLVREQVNQLVAKQMYEKIASLRTSDDFGVIAHSLGTRVINDTLQRFRTEQIDQANFYRQGYKLKFLMLISDVTDLFGLPLNRDPFPPKNVFAPDTYDYLRTVSNRFDPIARIIPSSLKHWPEGRVSEELMGREVYRDILLDHVHETNVHGLTHYMLHPQITDEVFELAGFGRFLTETEPRYQAFPVLGPQVQPGLRGALSALMSSAAEMADNSWQTYINLVLKFGTLSEPGHGHDHVDVEVLT